MSQICALRSRPSLMVDIVFWTVLSGGIDNLEAPAHPMFRFSSMLRGLLILAFCLDGSAGLWKASAMAASTVQQLQANDDGVSEPHHGASAMAESTQDCPDAEVPGQGSGEHEDCDCAGAGCDCACDFLKVAVAHKVPSAGPVWLAFVNVLPRPETVGKSSLSSVFRPPIG
jgi:hypothetical protein